MNANVTKWAKILNGRSICREVHAAEEKVMKLEGVVVLFGASDDLAEFRGAIHDEAACYDGEDLYLTETGLLESHDGGCRCAFCGYEAAQTRAKRIEALWDKPDQPVWTYETTIPHETFDVMEDGEVYCRGIVFHLDDLKHTA